jgi:hypothetical protein
MHLIFDGNVKGKSKQTIKNVVVITNILCTGKLIGTVINTCNHRVTHR